MPKVKIMQPGILIEGQMNRAIIVIFVLHCIHAESTNVAATVRPSMVAAFAFALMSSSYTISYTIRGTRRSVRAARSKTLIGAYLHISPASSKNEQETSTNLASATQDPSEYPPRRS